VQRSWIERDPSVGDPFMTPDMVARQRLRIEGLVRQRRIHMLENPLIEDLDFVSYEEPGTEGGDARVSVMLRMSLVETMLDSDTGRVVAGRPGVAQERVQYWTFQNAEPGARWLLADVEQPGEGSRHLRAPLVGPDFAELSPEMVLREKYARGEMQIDEFERRMGEMIGEGPTYT
jgi:hypothetical protein